MALRIACDLDGTLADMDAALQREARRLFGPDVDLHAVPGERLESAEDVEGQIGATTDEEREVEAAGAATSDDVPRPPSRVEARLRPAPLTATPAPAAPPTPPQAARRPLTNSELRRLWAHVTQIENFWTSLGEIEPGAVARLAALAAQHRWEVIFLTQRPSSAGETAQIQSQRWLQAHGFEMPSVMVMQGSRGKVADALALDAVMDDRPENCLDVATDSKALPLLIWRMRAEQVPPGIARTGIETVYSMAEALARLEALTGDRLRKRTLIGRIRGVFGK